MRVNGLFGWVEHNNTRSIALLFSFILLMQPLAAIALFVPLLQVDPAHAPLYHWAGYAVRYVPAATLAAMVLFALQMWWHLKVVRKNVAFRFTDNADEPRLCALVEPLAIAAGIPTPYVGVIDSPAMNAFACGISRKSSVVVFTRGIIDRLDDDELSSVIAHELVHIRNGDARLIAAANAFLRNMALLDGFSGWKPKRYRQVASLLWVPALFPLYLGVALLSQLCLRLGFASRLLISSAREFIADAEAIRLTQHPAALVSALQRIQGNSELVGLPFEQDAMMIDGMAQGRLATHPPLMDRIQAIVATTGQMALEARPRRDTRNLSGLRPGGFGHAGLVAQNMPALEHAATTGAAPRAGSLRAFRQVGSDRLILGLRWDIATAMLATFLTAMAVHHGDLRGIVGRLGQAPALLSSMVPLLNKVHACESGFQRAPGQDNAPAGECEALRQAFNAQTKSAGIKVVQDGRLLSDTQIAMLSPAELDRDSDRQPMPNGGFMIPVMGGKPVSFGPPTDLMPLYAMPVHEAWQRLAGGSIAPFMRALQCGLLVHAHTSAITDQSVTWSVTTEAVERLRFTATLTPDGPDMTRITLAIADFQETTLVSDGRTPNAPTFAVTMRPALNPPLRPYFTEAMNAMLESRSFQTSRVMSPPAADEGAEMTSEICASHRDRLAMGERFSIHDRPDQP